MLVASLEAKLKRKLEPVKTVRGSQLIGKRYVPPFDVYSKDLAPGDTRYFRVVAGDRSTTGNPDYFVTLDAGTGIVHVAPAFGDDDWKVLRNEKKARPDLEMFCAVRPDGPRPPPNTPMWRGCAAETSPKRRRSSTAAPTRAVRRRRCS